MLGIRQHLQDVCVGSGCGADLTAWTGWLVDERAQGTCPLGLLREAEQTKDFNSFLFTSVSLDLAASTAAVESLQLQERVNMLLYEPNSENVGILF